jgi:hypothetical protein
MNENKQPIKMASVSLSTAFAANRLDAEYLIMLTQAQPQVDILRKSLTNERAHQMVSTLTQLLPAPQRAKLLGVLIKGHRRPDEASISQAVSQTPHLALALLSSGSKAIYEDLRQARDRANDRLDTFATVQAELALALPVATPPRRSGP